MIQPDRLRHRLNARGLSQSELARRIGVTQATINKLAVGRSYDSKHLHKIARELATTPAYLEGEVDDPDANAPPAPPPPTVQLVTMQVALPSEAALAAMFEAQLRVFQDLRGAELARELAKRLPNGLARLQGVTLIEESAANRESDEDDPPLSEDHREARRAQHR